MSRRLPLAWAAALAVAALIPAAARQTSPPLTNEDVVRMVSQGRPEAEILRIIAASPADFEIDREMAEELRGAGITERILNAMRERQAIAGVRPPAVASAPSAPPPRGTLRLGFAPLENSRAKKAPSFQMVRKIPRWAIQRLEMEEKAEVEELAFFAACTTPDHVPDHWQDRTQLKDFARHEMLYFQAGSHPGRTKGFEVLVLDLPSSLSVPVPEGTHRLAVGVAAKIGPGWRVVASDSRPGVLIRAGGTTRAEVKIRGKLTGSGSKGFEEEQGISLGAVEAPEEAP